MESGRVPVGLPRGLRVYVSEWKAFDGDFVESRPGRPEMSSSRTE